MTVRVRVTRDCEHGEEGRLLDVDESKLEAFLAEGKVEVVAVEEAAAPEPEPEQGPEEEPEPDAEPAQAKRQAPKVAGKRKR